MKAPLGDGRNTIGHQMQRASGQSPNLVLDASHTLLPDDYITDEVQRRIDAPGAHLERVWILRKDGVVVEIKPTGR